MTFGKRLAAAVHDRGPLCAGIDPHPALLEAWDLPIDPQGLARFAAVCVEAFGDVAAVLKPQSAFFERFGSAGIAVLERTIADARAAGALVLLDVKRGDIGSTMAAYATAYLDRMSPLATDAITVSPFVGVGSLQPAFDAAAHNEAGLFVLAATSNPEAPQLQHAIAAGGRSVAQTVIDDVADRNDAQAELGSFGVVVGATITPGTVRLDDFPGPILAPGIGAQGATADDVRNVFGTALPRVLPSVSRELLRHGPVPAALRAAARQLAEEFAFLTG
jgi:orotidine-5'-phosphate decarboxylase